MKLPLMCIFLLSTVTVVITDLSLNDLQAAVRLFFCSLNGHDNGVRTAFRQLIMGRKKPLMVERCLFGCELGWLVSGAFITNYFSNEDTIRRYIEYFDSEKSIVQSLGVNVVLRFYHLLRMCLEFTVDHRKKCEIWRKVPECMARVQFPGMAMSVDLTKPILHHKLDLVRLHDDAIDVSHRFDQIVHLLVAAIASNDNRTETTDKEQEEFNRNKQKFTKLIMETIKSLGTPDEKDGVPEV